MKPINFISGVLTGLAVGHLAYHYILEPRQQAHPDEVLQQLKSQFKNTYDIKNSWISYETQSYKHLGLTYDVLRGGFSNSNFTKRYEFIADSKSGLLMDLFPVA